MVRNGTECMYLCVDVVIGKGRRRRQSEVIEVVEVETNISIVREHNDGYLTVLAVDIDAVDQLTSKVQHQLIVVTSNDARSTDENRHIRPNTTG